MHWSDSIALDIVKRSPDKDIYTCAAGISPSGSIHIGNFRDIATSYFVVKALERLGKNARLLFSWDEFDRLRKIPKNVSDIDQNMEQYIGYPYVDIRNPFGDGCKTYAEYFEKEFESSIKKLGIEMVYRYQADMYRSGKYKEYVILALSKRKEIFDILDSFRTQESSEEDREAYYPVSIYCPICHKDTTQITELSKDCVNAHYRCVCGNESDFNFNEDFNCKLAWKVDWPMRWMYESVDFEPGGKDHASPNGSYQTSKIISEKIFGYQAPLFQGYEFIGIKGSTGKMSGSSGLNLTPETLLKIYQPEIILWLYSKTIPTKAFDFCFDDGILRQYFEFDKQYDAYQNQTADELTNVVISNCLVGSRKIHTVPMGLMVQLGSVVNFNISVLQTVFKKLGTPYTEEELMERLPLAKYWLEHCAPENKNTLRTTRNWHVYDSFSEQEKEEIRLLYIYLAEGGYSLEDLNHKLYEIPKFVFPDIHDKNELKKLQSAFFANVYKLLIDKEKGPRLYLFLYAVETDQYLRLLDFETPKTELELTAETAAEETAAPEEENITVKEPDPVPAVKNMISFDAFETLDFRVCKVVKCTEIRKSHSCLKLTLFDGIGERVIVSSIKKEYKPEELIGKKIIVLANLKPAKFSGVMSEGMLMAATNNACGCKVIFADDSIPEGTQIK